ncbi:MAG: hypothetical protein EOP11_02440 [Proteobacteria bacterium]|nr:MAG: hypothetical protein EOP11_02440 [Pseudomonadota bacterium]
MKKLLALALFLTSASAFASVQCGEIEQRGVNRAVSYFNAGEITNTDVQIAKLRLNEALKACGKIDLATYCANGLPAATIAALGVEEESRVGQRSNDEVTNAQIVQANYEAACK